MHVVHSNQHHKHATRLALPGYDADYLEIPDRAEAILAAVASAQLGPVISAVDFGLALAPQALVRGVVVGMDDALANRVGIGQQWMLDEPNGKLGR